MSDGQVPYIIRGDFSKFRVSSQHRCAPVADALERAWPGVRILRLQSAMDCRDPRGGIGGHYHNEVTVYVALSGSLEALTKADLVAAEDLPPTLGKNRTFGWVKITRRKTLIHLRARINLQACVNDNDVSEQEQRIRDAMARALWPAIWRRPA